MQRNLFCLSACANRALYNIFLIVRNFNGLQKMNGDGSPLVTEARNERDGRPLIDNLPINGLCPLQACQNPHNNEELLSLSCTCGLCGDGMVIDASPTTECSNDNGVLGLSTTIKQKIDKHAHCFSGRRQDFIKKEHDLIGACVKAGVCYQPPNIDKKSGKTRKRLGQLWTGR